MKSIAHQCIIFAAVILLLAGQISAAPNRICIPVASGVPGGSLSGPPNWWDPSVGTPLFDTSLDAPSWRGASAATFPSSGGTSDEVRFRALHAVNPADGREYLYLSWRGLAIPGLQAPGNELWLGFQNTATQNAVAIEIPVSVAINATATPLPAPLNVRTSTGGGGWVAQTPLTLPWLTGTAGTGRLWVTLAANSWSLQIRVPLTTSSDPNTGINIGTPAVGTEFKMWFEFRAGAPNPNGYIPYVWPRTAPDMVFVDPPPFANWGTTRITAGTPESPDALCPADGVSLKTWDIHTTDALQPNTIRTTVPNTLRAVPHNGMPANNAALTASFSFANWGTQPNPEDVPNPNTTLWQPIATAGPVTIAPGASGNIDAPYDISSPAQLCERCKYVPFYLAHTSTCNSCPAATNNSRLEHQCLLVRLTGGSGIDFVNDSAFANTQFAPTSTFTEPAQVALLGLPETSPGSLARDVYFFVQTYNMPSRTSTTTGGGTQNGTVPIGNAAGTFTHGGNDSGNPATGNFRAQIPPEFDPNVPREQRQALILSGLAAGKLTYDDLLQKVPAYIVHVYFDTGRRGGASGNAVILHPMNSFGYFPMHDGNPEGWAYGLGGVEQLAPNWYRLHVGPSGLATVYPRIEAIERGSSHGAWRFFVDLGPNFPHGSFANGVDGKWSANVGVERLITSDWSVEGIFGYHAFDVQEVSNPHIWQFSVNGKRWFGNGSQWHPFLNAGAGAYRFDPGNTTKVGWNAGGGVLYDVTSTWGVEGVYNYHSVHASGDAADFSTVQVGARIRF